MQCIPIAWHYLAIDLLATSLQIIFNTLIEDESRPFFHALLFSCHHSQQVALHFLRQMKLFFAPLVCAIKVSKWHCNCWYKRSNQRLSESLSLWLCRLIYLFSDRHHQTEMKTLEKQLAVCSSGIALEKSTVERSVESVTTTSLYDFFPMVIAVLSNLVLIRDSWFILAMRATSFSKHLCSFVW